jgi:hypothetical protein
LPDHGKRLSHDERSEVVNVCNHVIAQAMDAGDLVLVEDAAAMLWSQAMHTPKAPRSLSGTSRARLAFWRR